MPVSLSLSLSLFLSLSVLSPGNTPGTPVEP